MRLPASAWCAGEITLAESDKRKHDSLVVALKLDSTLYGERMSRSQPMTNAESSPEFLPILQTRSFEQHDIDGAAVAARRRFGRPKQNQLVARYEAGRSAHSEQPRRLTLQQEAAERPIRSGGRHPGEWQTVMRFDA